MPPRIPAPQGLRTLTLCLRPSLAPAPNASLQPLIQKANLSAKEQAKKEKKRLMKQDPYTWAQKQQRKNAHIKRKEELEAERKANWGSPIHGITTPFVESFDSAGQSNLSIPRRDGDGNPIEEPHPLPTSENIINNQLSKEELEKAVEQSRKLLMPLEGEQLDPRLAAEEMQEYEKHHANAIIALQRITDLKNGSAKDRKHANIRRCIETFGRHVTDKSVPNAAPPLARGVKKTKQPKRAGPDTGSSEVQIAILTAKIRALSNALNGHKGYKDKVNKRNLRLLCHKRQRLLRYMERKERGSGRWQFMLKTLGLTPATWKEQISF
ncbi:hypothetical protein QBC38DRAFT_488181 [Podospora fimiseda]|uniref:Mitochondrial SSU ribosomal protein S15 n=1 Tax=Podospora fimiseda TaxID=252190 RepID=A0AAN7BH21_9PEZI|nr:hypothetical protein QBC38DRAFT_488181 [Podospora fimiseda]